MVVRCTGQDAKFKNLVALCILIHVLLLKASFDLYFSSPIDHGMTPVLSTKTPPAKRLVLMIADGLRAEAVYDDSKSEIPFLRELMATRASWGISHTRVPTESRPGHVAILAGIYEDPSAIVKGWQANPVNFDSVLNQSVNSWCWGSPDIINVFNKDNSPHIRLHSYDARLEDFGKQNTSLLDAWVFDKVTDFLATQVECEHCLDIHKEGNIFFLHLLGMDTAGHGFKPYSKEYYANIEMIDRNIRLIEAAFEKSFADSSSAYVFTADHGMTNWGSHGAGSTHETETPFIAWGPGLKPDNVRKDLNQIDIAPLISSMIGINIPTNSLGKLPNQYLNVDPKTLAEMMFANTLQLLQIFNVKRIRTEQNALVFEAYEGITTDTVNEKMIKFAALAEAGRYDDLIKMCKKFMDVLIKGADYYHNYYQRSILISITVGFFEWIVYLAIFNVDYFMENPRQGGCCYKPFVVLYFLSAVLVFIQRLPVMYYLYFTFPLAMGQLLWNKLHVFAAIFRTLNNFKCSIIGLYLLLIFGGVQLLVWGFYGRHYISVVLLVMIIWIFASPTLKRNLSMRFGLVWSFTCCGLAAFPLLPEMNTEFNGIAYVAGFSILRAFIKYIMSKMDYRRRNRVSLQVIDMQIYAFQFAFVNSLLIHWNLMEAQMVLKLVSWFISVLSIIVIPLTNTNVYIRFTSIFLGFLPYYLLVSTNHELLFMTCYAIVLYMWMRLESVSCNFLNVNSFDFATSVPSIGQAISLDDFRRAFFFVALIFVGFFGAGNTASINSFDPMWVKCFLTVFSPFTMTILIIVKIMIPFVYTCATYKIGNMIHRAPVKNMFCLVLFFSDIMLIQFLYKITNVGSWLEIGMSLSHFIIMEAFVLFVLIVYGVVYCATTVAYVQEKRENLP